MPNPEKNWGPKRAADIIKEENPNQIALGEKMKKLRD